MMDWTVKLDLGLTAFFLIAIPVTCWLVNREKK